MYILYIHFTLEQRRSFEENGIRIESIMIFYRVGRTIQVSELL